MSQSTCWCPKCGRKAEYDVVRSGFEDLSDVYKCNHCGLTEEVRGTQMGPDRGLARRWRLVFK